MYDICKMINQFTEDISYQDIEKLFNLNTSQMEELLKFSNKLFEKKEIDWKIVNKTIYRRKKEKNCLCPDTVI